MPERRRFMPGTEELTVGESHEMKFSFSSRKKSIRIALPQSVGKLSGAGQIGRTSLKFGKMRGRGHLMVVSGWPPTSRYGFRDFANNAAALSGAPS